MIVMCAMKTEQQKLQNIHQNFNRIGQLQNVPKLRFNLQFLKNTRLTKKLNTNYLNEFTLWYQSSVSYHESIKVKPPDRN